MHYVAAPASCLQNDCLYVLYFTHTAHTDTRDYARCTRTFAFASFSPSSSFFFSRVPPSPFFRFYSLSFRLVYRSPLVSFLLLFSGTHWGGSRAALTRWGLLRIIARSNRPNGSLVPLYRSIPGCSPSTGPCWVWKQTGYPGPGTTDDARGAAARCRCSIYVYRPFRRSNGTLTRGGFTAASISFRFYSRFSQLLRRVFVYFSHRPSFPSLLRPSYSYAICPAIREFAYILGRGV